MGAYLDALSADAPMDSSDVWRMRMACRSDVACAGSDAFAFSEALPGGLTVRRRLPATEHRGGGERGEVNGMSLDSRRRLTRRLMRVPWQSFTADNANALRNDGFFVTLTYPSEYPGAWECWKRHLDLMIRRIKRRYKLPGLI